MQSGFCFGSEKKYNQENVLKTPFIYSTTDNSKIQKYYKKKNNIKNTPEKR